MAIDFRWGQSGTSNFSLGTSASVSAGTINTINQNDLLIAVVVPTAIAVLGPDGKQVIDPVTGLPEVTADPGPVAVPDGWTQLDNTALQLDGFPADAAIFYKIADGTENGNFTFSWSNPADYSWTLLDYSGVDTSSPIDVSGGQTNTGQPIAPIQQHRRL